MVLYGTLRGGWLDAVLAGIALGMSMLPEEFPVVLTVFMAMGAWRISQARVLTRRAAAIETLGSATVLCTDKTGTLTENRMTIAELRLADDDTFRPRETPGATMPERFHAAGRVSASSPARASRSIRWRRRSTSSAASGWPAPGICTAPDWKLVHAYGLRPDLLAMSQVWQAADGTAGIRRRGQGRAGGDRRSVPPRPPPSSPR